VDPRDAAGILEDSLLMAVPKKKISASKKRLRNANKKLPFINEVIRCRICEKIKPPHFYCEKGCAIPGNMGKAGEEAAGQP
jgi:large subunit ribosomal protein L32